jgi:uncharacterized UPF0160 family protein
MLQRLPKNRKPVFATHSGTFHCDEVVALSMLRMLVPEFTLVRSRDDSELKAADIVVDVGGVFDSETMRFDHHQRGFDGFFSENNALLECTVHVINKTEKLNKIYNSNYQLLVIYDKVLEDLTSDELKKRVKSKYNLSDPILIRTIF